MADDEPGEDKELHNSGEKLHNSSDTPDADDDQPAETEPYTYVVDLGDEQIYYHSDEKGKLHSYDFLQEDLILSAEDFSEEELRKAEKMKKNRSRPRYCQNCKDVRRSRKRNYDPGSATWRSP